MTSCTARAFLYGYLDNVGVLGSTNSASCVVFQEREQLSTMADKGTKLRLRHQDVVAKQEQLNVLTQNTSKLEAFLARAGKGNLSC